MVEIIAKSTYSEKRTRDFFKFHLFKISPMKYLYFSIALVFFGVFFVLFLKMNYGSSLFFLFISIMVLVVRIASTNMLVNSTVKKVIFPSINYQLIFNENEITYTYPNFKQVYKWDDILFIYELENYIYFYVTKNSALILNKYVLKETERNKIKEFILNSKIKYKVSKFK